MGKVITFINEKGGVGKSQMAFSLSWEMTTQGSKILLMDLDGQRANLTFMSGVDKTDDMVTMYDVFQKNKPPQTAIVKIKDNLDIIPANNDVSDISQKSTIDRARAIIKELSPLYDYIFIDVSPSPDWRQFLALIMSDYAMVIMLPDMMSLEANNGILESLSQCKEINRSLKVLGILFNRYEARSNMSKEVQRVVEKYAKAMNTQLFKTTIRNTVYMGESAYAHKGITEYYNNSDVADDIRKLVKELKERI